jgi:hypothetical protein
MSQENSCSACLEEFPSSLEKMRHQCRGEPGFDPKLREAAEEFKAICEKYDCVSVALFVSPTHAEFVNHLSPSWSVMKLERGPEGQCGFRFRSKLADFPSREKQHECTEATIHALTSVIEWTRKTHQAMQQIVEQLGKHMRIGWKTWSDPDSVPRD